MIALLRLKNPLKPCPAACNSAKTNSMCASCSICMAYLIDKCLYNETVDLFADDGEVRFFGGIWRGKEGARRLYVERFQKRFTHGTNGPIDGFLLDHPQIQDIVDIDPNGEFAYARARSMMQAGRHRDYTDPTQQPRTRPAPVVGRRNLREYLPEDRRRLADQGAELHARLACRFRQRVDEYQARIRALSQSDLS